MRRQSATKKVALKLLMGCCLFFCACSAESEQPTPETAKRFLKLRGYDFDEKSFFSAAARGDLIAVNGFLSAGINPNAKDQDGDTALTSSAARGDSKIVNALLQGKADVNTKGRNGWTALLLALESERNEVADLLLAQSNVDLKAETPNGMTALMLAVWHQRVLDKGADPRIKDVDGVTAAGWAAKNGQGNIAMLLHEAEKR